MPNQKQCVDYYGERLKVGDEVIPVIGEALIFDIAGVISKIVYSKRYDQHFITITDKEGKILLENVNSRYYTTRAREDEKENQEYVYSLTFYNDNFSPLTHLPLTNKTDVDYEFPENTCLVSLDTRHLTKKSEGGKWFHGETIYYYFFEGNIKLCCDEKNKDFYYLMNDKDYWYQIDINKGYKIAQNEEELKKCVKAIIEYFRSSDLSHVNNDVLYDENKEGKAFEKQLINRLNH